MIDPRALRTYLAVCREGSISGAARRLNISQPAVSVTVAQLEEGLKTSLFERTRSGIVLTEAGRGLMRRAEALEAVLRDAEEEIVLTRHGVQGPLRIGGTPGALVSLVPQAVTRMGGRGARFTLHVIERPDADLVDLLRKAEIEIAVVTTGIEAPPEDIEERSFGRDPFDLVVGRANDHLPAQLSLRDAADLRWVLPAAIGAFRRQVDALFIAAEVSAPRDVVRCDSLLTTKAIVSGGEHVTILPHGVVAAELAMGTLRAIRLTEAHVSRNIGVRYMAGGRLSDLAQQLLHAMAANREPPLAAAEA